MIFKTNKQKGYDGEKIVLDFYLKNGYKLIYKNRTIPGGEIDLIMEKSADLVFLEVKNVLYIDDIYNYITPKKLATLKKTIETYVWKFPTDKSIHLDIVFVKGKDILEVYKDVEI